MYDMIEHANGPTTTRPKYLMQEQTVAMACRAFVEESTSELPWPMDFTARSAVTSGGSPPKNGTSATYSLLPRGLGPAGRASRADRPSHSPRKAARDMTTVLRLATEKLYFLWFRCSNMLMWCT